MHINVDNYETFVTPVTPEKLRASIIESITDLAKGVQSTLEVLNIDRQDPSYDSLFILMYEDARRTFNDRVFDITGSHH